MTGPTRRGCPWISEGCAERQVPPRAVKVSPHAERTKGVATPLFVLVKSLLVPSEQCDPTVSQRGPSAPFHAIVRAAI